MKMTNDNFRIREVMSQAVRRYRDSTIDNVLFGDGMAKRYTATERIELIDDVVTYSDRLL